MKTAMHKAGAVSILVVCCEQGLQGGSAALYWDSETGVRPPRPTGGLPGLPTTAGGDFRSLQWRSNPVHMVGSRDVTGLYLY